MSHPRPILSAACALVAVLAFLPAPPAGAQGQARRSDALRERIKTRPDDPTLHYYLALFQIAEGDESAGVATLARAGTLGAGFLPPGESGSTPCGTTRASSACAAASRRSCRA